MGHPFPSIQPDRRQRGEVVKALLSNCSIKDGTLTPTYRKPFDLIIEGLKNEEWGEYVDGVRISSDEVWSVFLREFKHWCASEEVDKLVKLRPIDVLKFNTPSLL